MLKYKQAADTVQTQSGADRILPAGCKKEPEDVRIAARGLLSRRMERAMERYIVEERLNLDGISNSKKGVIQSLCTELQYVPGEARACLTEYMNHSEVKDSRRKDHGQTKRQDKLRTYVRGMLERQLTDILKDTDTKWEALGLGIADVFSEEELMRFKLQLMIRQIRYANREGRENED